MKNAPDTLVFETNEAEFEQSVIQASHARPVLVDFWADWCQPCKMLMPVLNRVVEQLAGQVLLAKVNTDQNQQLAMQMGIRSLPTVRLYRNGRAVAEFMGAQPEHAIREFLAPHLPSPAHDACAAAGDALEAGDTQGAEQILRSALAETPAAKAPSIALARLLLGTGRAEEAETLLDGLASEDREDDDVRRLRGQLQFARRADGIADPVALEARLETESADEQTLRDAAALRVVEGRFEEALALLLRLLKRNRTYGDDAARRDMLAIFEMLDGDSPLVREYRRKLASALF